MGFKKELGGKFKFLFFLIIFISLIFLTYFSLALINSDSSSTDEWLMFHRNLNQTGYYPDSVNMTNFSLIWSYSTAGDVLSSPVIFGETVYFGSLDHNLYALNISNNGSYLWNYTTGDNIGGSPAIANGIIYIGSNDANLYALNISNNGSQIWNYTTGDAIIAAPAVANDIVYIGSLDSKFYALNATNGTLIWSYTGQQVMRNFAPVVVNNIVYFMQPLATNVPFIFAFNATNGTHQIWNYTYQFSSSASYMHSPMVVDDVAYVPHSSYLFAFNATNGTLIWTYTADSDISSPAFANNTIYFGTADRYVYGVWTNGSLRWSYTDEAFGSGFRSSPAIAEDILFIGATNRRFYAINATSGTFIWKYAAAIGEFGSSPAIVNGIVYIGSDDNRLYAFSNTSGECVEIWTYSEWSACSNNLQTRTGLQWNKVCATLTTTESQTCSSGEEPGSRPDTPATTIDAEAETSISVPIEDESLDVVSVTIRVKEKVSNASVEINRIIDPTSVDPGKKDFPSGVIYKAFTIETERIENKKIANVTIEFRVTKEWMEKNNYTYDFISLYRKQTLMSEWEKLDTTSVRTDDPIYYYYSAISPGFSTFIVYAGDIECAEGFKRCFDNNVQICNVNKTWEILEVCKNGCEDQECTNFLKKILPLPLALALIFITSGAIIFILIYLKKKQKKDLDNQSLTTTTLSSTKTVFSA